MKKAKHFTIECFFSRCKEKIKDKIFYDEQKMNQLIKDILYIAENYGDYKEKFFDIMAEELDLKWYLIEKDEDSITIFEILKKDGDKAYLILKSEGNGVFRLVIKRTYTTCKKCGEQPVFGVERTLLKFTI